MAFVGPKIFQQTDRAKMKEAEIRLMSLAQAIQTYRLEQNAFPPNLDSLVKPSSGGMPYAKPDDLKDAWGSDYRYTVPGNGKPFDLVSLGADGKEGGDGPNKDITNK